MSRFGPARRFFLMHVAGSAVLGASLGSLPANASVPRHVESVASPGGAPVPVIVMTPPSYESTPARRYPVLYFLHDAGGNEAVLFREGLADALATQMRDGSLPEMLVVSPRGVGTWFVDSPATSSRPATRTATFLTESLVPFIDARYRTIASRGSRLAAGISMGGYGALRWALTEPGLFTAVGGLSPAIQQMCWPAVQAMPFFIRPSVERAFGDDPVRNVLRKNDLYAMLLDDAGLAARAPFLFVRCGTEDRYRLAEISSFFDKYLRAFGVSHEVVLEAGGHDWSYWRRVFPDFVRVLAARLSPAEVSP